jgi:hypothetical protein
MDMWQVVFVMRVKTVVLPQNHRTGPAIPGA